MAGWRLPNRAWPRASALFAACLVGLLHGVVACRREVPPERIVLVVVDTLRRDRLGAYGGRVSTPYLDALAAEGTRFEQAHGAFHQTTMSMGALFTGHTPSFESRDASAPLPWTGHTWCGLVRFAADDADSCVPAGVPTLAEHLRDAGYHTAAVVSNLLLFRPAGFDRGFRDWIEVGPVASAVRAAQAGGEIRYDPRTTAGDRVNRAVFRWLAERPSDHFFLYVHYMDVHDWFMHRASYDERVEAVDRSIGALRRELEASGLLDGTTLVVTADHGEWLREPYVPAPLPTHGGNPSYQPVLEVPLIVWPAIDADTHGIRRSDDTFRLLLRLAGVTAPSPADLEPEELLVGERLFRTYRRGRWKSVFDRGSDRALLFDLEGDAGELRNVAAEHPEELARHRERVAALSRALAGQSGVAEPSAADLERLRALGYVE